MTRKHTQAIPQKCKVISITSARTSDNSKPWYALLAEAFAEAGEEIPPALVDAFYLDIGAEWLRDGGE